jgi:hypothetical protein
MTRAGEARAHAVLRHVFPDMAVIEVIPNRSNMTDVIDSTSTEDTGWTEATAVAAPQVVSYPETPANPHNHLFTLSLVPDKAPFLAIRANSTQELLGIMDALESDGVYAAMGAAQAAFREQGTAGRGPVAPAPVQMPQAPAQGVPQGPGAPANAFNPQGHFNVPQGNQPPPFGPNVSVPGAPAYQGPPVQQGYAPAPQQGQQWGGQPQAPQAAPQGWYRMNVPYPGGKDVLNQLAAQMGIPKGNPAKGGKYNFWSAPAKAWYCAPEVAQAFAQFSPVPA